MNTLDVVILVRPTANVTQATQPFVIKTLGNENASSFTTRNDHYKQSNRAMFMIADTVPAAT